jgi:radical SAM superfamily enzyme YgiQ (UPF0313 family)
LRPPAEASSLLLQVTTGCSLNKCTFCNFCKDRAYSIRPYEQVEADIMEARQMYRRVPAVFLVNGNALSIPMKKLRPIRQKAKEVIPESAHTSMYGTFKDVTRKTVDKLKEFHEL